MSQFIEAIVDQGGLVQIPKAILEELEFEPGSRLYFELSENGEVKLRKGDSPARLVNKGGIKVIRVIPASEIQDALERDREERLTSLMNGLEYENDVLVFNGKMEDDVAQNWLAIIRHKEDL